MATVRPHSRKALDRNTSRPVTVEVLSSTEIGCRAEAADVALLEERPFPSSRGIADARLVIAGGKGFRKKDGFALLFGLTEHTGGEVRASREAVDRGWADYPRQVGLSGRTISPIVYMAFGISGAIQHLAGMQTAETVISINTDPDAPLAAMSDLAIRADLYELIPVLTARLEAYRSVE